MSRSSRRPRAAAAAMFSAIVLVASSENGRVHVPVAGSSGCGHGSRLIRRSAMISSTGRKTSSRKRTFGDLAERRRACGQRRGRGRGRRRATACRRRPRSVSGIAPGKRGLISSSAGTSRRWRSAAARCATPTSAGRGARTPRRCPRARRGARCGRRSATPESTRARRRGTAAIDVTVGADDHVDRELVARAGSPG